MHTPDLRLIIFAKAPVSGQVKTRLAKRVGNDRATRIHRQLTLHTLETAVQHLSCPIELWCAPDTDHEFFQACRRRHPLSLHIQQGEDLGARMSHAFSTALAQGGKAVLIGTDCPLLNGAHLDAAFGSLARGHDTVIIPAEDGGYVLIGLSRHDPGLFTHIAWGAPSVCQDTIHRLEELEWSWQALKHLWDIDTGADLDRLLALERQAAISARLQQLVATLRTCASHPT